MLFTPAEPTRGEEGHPLARLEARQARDRERLDQARRRTHEELHRAARALTALQHDPVAWRLLRERRIREERRWTRDYKDMLWRQARERRRLAERIARGEVTP